MKKKSSFIIDMDENIPSKTSYDNLKRKRANSIRSNRSVRIKECNESDYSILSNS